MPLNAMPDDHPKFPPHGRTGLLLVNLGTPDGTDKKNMRKYLKQFLSDTRVIEVPKALWWVILNGIILNVRPKRSGAAYDRIWLQDDPTDRRRARSRACRPNMWPNGSNRRADGGWPCYGEPSIQNQLRDRGRMHADRADAAISHAASTTATAMTSCKWMLNRRWQPPSGPCRHGMTIRPISALANTGRRR